MKKLCTYPACRNITTDGNPRCEKHRKPNKRRAEVIERSSFYKTSSWINLSRRIRIERPVCEICDNALTQDADHWLERSIKGAEKYELDERNIVCMCKACHYRKGSELKRLILNEQYQELYLKLVNRHPRQMDATYLHDWRKEQIAQSKEG